MLRIATRKSPLAVWQAKAVSARLKITHVDLDVELVPMSTQGDRVLDSPLAKIGGKGLFVKELELALLNGDADIAVHSMKDVPVELPPRLHLAAILQREDPHDAFVSNDYATLAELPAGARLGTSSLRRQCQINAAHPRLVVEDLRGNVNTRIAKLDAGHYDAIVLACAGLKRLDLPQRIRQTLSSRECLPAIGQGAMGIECRVEDTRVNEIIASLDHPQTHLCVLAERTMNACLNGGCQVPLAGFAQLKGQELRLRGLIGYPDGRNIIRSEASGAHGDADKLGIAVAEDLLSQGADRILHALGL